MPAVASAAPDPAAAVARWSSQDQLLLDVGERLAVGAAPLCGPGGWSAGFAIQQRDQYAAEYRPAATTLLGLGDLPTVAVIAQGSAAARAGLRVGDQIEAIDGRSLPISPPQRLTGSYAGVAAATAVLDLALADDGAAALAIRRGGQRQVIMLQAGPACRVRFEVRTTRSSNASADGIIVQLGSDLIADAAGADEVAAVAAHELAHNILRHPARLKARERGLTVKATEVEADRLSIYLLDAAGYPTSAAVSFWAGWGRAHDRGIFADGSHPGWRRRVAVIERERAAIAARRASGHPVAPPVELRAPAG